MTRLVLVLLPLLALPRCGPPVPYDPTGLQQELPEVVAALARGEPEQALQALQARIDAHTAPDGVDHYLGLAHAEAGQHESAVAAFARELDRHPGNGHAHAFLAESLTALGRLEQARRHLDQARQLVPELAYLALIAGRLSLLQDRDEEAARHLRAYLVQDAYGARAAEAHHGLARIETRAGRLDAARRHGELSEHLEQVARYLNLYRQRLADDPDDVVATMGVGMIYLSLYREVRADPELLEQADAAFAAVLARQPEDVRALYNLGFVRTAQERGIEAEAYYERVMALDPEHVGARINTALLARARGDDEAARTHLLVALAGAATSDERARAHVELGLLLEQAGHHDAAREHYRAALAEDPADARDATSRLQDLPDS